MPTHRAVRFHQFGGLDRLSIDDVDTPQPGPDDALVRVFSAAVNHLDLDLLAETSGYPVGLPHTLGMEGAGVVEAVGAEVTTARRGDRVLVASDIVCGRCEFCLSDRDNLCVDAVRPGMTDPGAYAEIMGVPASGLYRLPEGVSFDDAACAQVSFGTAWRMLVTRGGLRPHEWVLVMGAAGNIGMGALRVAKHSGAKVIAASSSVEKRRRLLSDGADAAADPSDDAFVDKVRSVTGGQGVDLVFEHLGGDFLQRGLECLRPTGRLVTCGAHSGEIARLDVIGLFRSELTVIGSNSATSAEVLAVLELVGQGKLSSTIAGIFPLARTGEGLELMASRGHYGRILIHPQE